MYQVYCDTKEMLNEEGEHEYTSAVDLFFSIFAPSGSKSTEELAVINEQFKKIFTSPRQ
jgi:hypothetical protein